MPTKEKLALTAHAPMKEKPGAAGRLASQPKTAGQEATRKLRSHCPSSVARDETNLARWLCCRLNSMKTGPRCGVRNERLTNAFLNLVGDCSNSSSLQFACFDRNMFPNIATMNISIGDEFYR